MECLTIFNGYFIILLLGNHYCNAYFTSNSKFCFRPCDRNVKDVELICARLRRVEQICRLPNSVLQQLALCGYYEDLEKGVIRKFTFITDAGSNFCYEYLWFRDMIQTSNKFHYLLRCFFSSWG